MKQYILNIFLSVNITFLFLAFSSCIKVRKTLDLGMCRSMEVSQQRGAFVFAYAPDSIILFDSVPVVIKEAFVERHRQYKNMESDSIVFWPKWYHTIILFEERKPWHRCHYKVNTRNISLEKLKSYYPKDSINWALDNGYSIHGPGRIIYNTKSTLPEDELFIYIEQIHLTDEAYNRDTISRLDIKRDTLGCLHLVKKELTPPKNQDPL